MQAELHIKRLTGKKQAGNHKRLRAFAYEINTENDDQADTKRGTKIGRGERKYFIVYHINILITPNKIDPKIKIFLALQPAMEMKIQKHHINSHNAVDIKCRANAGKGAFDQETVISVPVARYVAQETRTSGGHVWSGGWWWGAVMTLLVTAIVL